ncbi:MAG: DUF2651 family protein [Clostridia bacterium]|nr:DUF2651 family protein [Clostridia bacterium]
MTTNILIFFAIPLAIIVISIALQKILRNPFLVSAIIFSIALVIVLAFLDPIYLIAVVAYTLLSLITAFLTCLLCGVLSNSNMCNCMVGGNNNNNNDDDNDNNCTNQVVATLGEGNTNQTYYTGCYRKRR